MSTTMIDKNNIIGFELSISSRDDGTLEAVYIRFRDGEVERTKEIEEDVLVGDYDAQGNLLGIEILAPVRLADLEKFVELQNRNAFRRVVKSSPCDMIECA